MVNEIDNILRRWIVGNGYTMRVFAQAIGVDEGNFSAMLAGKRNWSPVTAERIRVLTSDVVTPGSLHKIRVSWIKTHRPDINLKPLQNLPLQGHPQRAGDGGLTLRPTPRRREAHKRRLKKARVKKCG